MILFLSVLILGYNGQGLPDLPDRPDDGPDLGCDVSLSLEEKIKKFRTLEIELIGENYEEAKLELNEGIRDNRTVRVGCPRDKKIRSQKPASNNSFDFFSHY